MKIVRIDGLAPGRTELELHPQLTLLRGVTPEMRRRLYVVFRSFSTADDPGVGGLIEVSGVQLGLDRSTLADLHLDPDVDAILGWHDEIAAPDVEPSTATRWNPPVPVFATPVPDRSQVLAAQVGVDRERLREVTTLRTELGGRMAEVRTRLDSFANAALEVCVGQIDALESRRSLLRSQWEHDRATRLRQREELGAQARAATDELEAVMALDLGPVSGACDALEQILDTPVEPDPVAGELAAQIDASMRRLRDLRGRASSAELRRHEAEQRLGDASVDATSAEQSMRTRVFDRSDVNRLEQVRDEIFAFDDRHSRLGAHRNKRKVQELRAEEAVLLERLGFDTYSSYVMGIPSVRAELERSSRLDSAMTRMEQIEREIESLAADEPDTRELLNARAELHRLLAGAAELLGRPAVVDLDAANTADMVHDTITALRGRRLSRPPDWDSEAFVGADRLRHAIATLAGGRFAASDGRSAPIIAGSQVDSAAWNGTPRELLHGVVRWVAAMAQMSRWSTTARASVAAINDQILELDRDDLHRNDVSEWAVVEAELDAALDRMAAAEERVRSHELAMTQLADLRDTELGLRAQERELLATVAQLEQERREAPGPSTLAESFVSPTTRLPPAYHATAADPLGAHAPSGAVQDASAEWTLIERLALQRVVSFIGSVPMLLDGIPSQERARGDVLARVRRMGEVVQLVVLSDDEHVVDWVSDLGEAATVVAL